MLKSRWQGLSSPPGITFISPYPEGQFLNGIWFVLTNFIDALYYTLGGIALSGSKKILDLDS